MKRSRREFQVALGVLIIIYSVGIAGFLWESTRPLFERLVPFNLLLAAGLLAWFHPEWNRKFGLSCLLIAVSGYFVEVIGVHTGFPFGEYWYETALGPKLWAVPPLIGLNWLLLVYTTGSVLSRLQVPVALQALIAALLMVGLDILIEPVAIRYHFWTWDSSVVPWQNFLSWGLVAFVMLLGFLATPGKKDNPLALPYLMISFVFFGVLAFAG